jgi:hypothetical protein
MSKNLFMVIALSAFILYCVGCASSKHPLSPDSAERTGQDFYSAIQLFQEGFPDPVTTYDVDSAVVKVGYLATGTEGDPYSFGGEPYTVAVTADEHMGWVSIFSESEDEILKTPLYSVPRMGYLRNRKMHELCAAQ